MQGMIQRTILWSLMVWFFNNVDYLINNACLSKKGIYSCTYDDFNYALRVGITAPYMLQFSINKIAVIF